MHRIKQWILEAKAKKHCQFDDLNKIVKRVISRYGETFPKYSVTRSGSKTVHHFNVPGLFPISLEKEHGSREFVPPRYKAYALEGIEALVAHIEQNLPPTHKVDDDDEPQEPEG